MSNYSSHHLWKSDLDGTDLTLTSECETSQELASFLEACRENTTVRTVAFRECFLPLRRIRQHLTRKEFVQMLQAICRLRSLVRLIIPPTMPGMLRGVTASYFLPEWPDNDDEGADSGDESYDEELYSSNLQEWIANGVVTFCTIQDVYAIAEPIEDLCPKLHCLEIQNFYFKEFRTNPRKKRQQQADNNNNHHIDEDDGDKECLLDPLFQAVSTQSGFTVLKISSHSDYMPRIEHQASTVEDAPSSPSFGIVAPSSVKSLLIQQYSSLKHLTLVRLGLVDQHFQVIGENLPRLQALETLDLNENVQTHRGTLLVLQALALYTPTTYPLMLLSMKPIMDLETTSVRQQVDMDWTLVFPRNVSLRYLETRTIDLREESGHCTPKSDDESDECSSDNQNQNAFLHFWLHLNRMHRCEWGKIALPESPLWPVLLERLGRFSVSAQWNCLQTFLPQMHHFQ